MIPEWLEQGLAFLAITSFFGGFISMNWNILAIKKNNEKTSELVNDECEKNFKTLLHNKKKIDELHLWHDRQDEEGVPVWYVRNSLEKTVERLAEAVESLATSANMQLRSHEALVNFMDKIDKKMDGLSNEIRSSRGDK